METLNVQQSDTKIKKWRENLRNLMISKACCGICYKDQELVDWDVMNVINNNDIEEEYSLKDIIQNTFGSHVVGLLATTHLCQQCVNTILHAYILLQNIKNNHKILENYTNIIEEQLNASADILNSNDAESIHLILDNITNIQSNDHEELIPSKYEIEIGNVDLKTENVVEDDPKHHIKSGKYQCPLCDKKINDLFTYKQHFDAVHEGSRFTCRHCMDSFNEMETLIEHRKLVHKEEMIFCYVCKIILLKHDSTMHIMKYHVEEEIACDICKEIFPTRYDLEMHMFTNHNINIVCQRCLKHFSRESRFVEHKCMFQCMNCPEDNCVHEYFLQDFRSQYMLGAEIFKCTDCDFRFHNKQELISHIDKEHLNMQTYSCHLCGDKYVDKELLREHSRKHLDTLNCQLCNGASLTKMNLSVHLPICNDKDSYECDLCGFSFNSQEKVTFHRRKHFPKEVECVHCSQKYWSKIELNKHIKKNHPNKDSTRKIYSCTMCPADFVQKSYYSEHIQQHSEDSRHECRTCGLTFKSKFTYYNHIRKHAKCHCPICDKQFDKYSLQRHMKIHNKDESQLIKVTSEKSMMCDECGKLLANEKALAVHREIHNDQIQCQQCDIYVDSINFQKHLKSHAEKGGPGKKYMKVCQHCDYATNFSECMKAHVNRFHLNVRPYQCDLCRKSFYTKLTLKEHIRTHTGEKPEQCYICGNRFACKKALMLHLRIHTGEKPYKCDLCDEKFLSSSRRQAHRIRKHFEPTFQCSECFKMFYTGSMLRKHLKESHSNEQEPKTQNIEVILQE